METDLKNIIEQIKKEGVDEAEKKSADIVSRAEQKAGEIIAAAKQNQDSIIRTAESKADKLRSNAEEAIKQASRDAILGLREQIVALFDKVIKREVEGHLSTDVIKEVIIRLAQDFKKAGTTDIEVLLGSKDAGKLEKVLYAKLKDEMKKGVTLQVASGIEKGFRIGEKGRNSYYDFTDEAVAETFKEFLNPKIKELLKPGTAKNVNSQPAAK